MLRISVAATLIALAAGSAPAGTSGGPLWRDAVRLAADWQRPPAKEGYSYPDCYCTDSDGRRVEVGQIACLQIGSRLVTSRCEQARNLVIWRHQEEGCPGV
ncbi:MAG: hypothetical protein AAFV49_06360 [Pseudomonadota bacterium]